jgi:hypothetical protein
MKSIPFSRVCEIINDATACIMDNDALSYPCVNEDCDGNDCIEINYYTEDGLLTHTFTANGKYKISKKGDLIIEEDAVYTVVTILARITLDK